MAAAAADAPPPPAAADRAAATAALGDLFDLDDYMVAAEREAVRAMLAPPEPRTFLLSADVTKTLRPFLVRVFRSEGLQPAPGADAEEPAVPVVRARQPGLSWSLLWTVANVRAGQAPAGAGAGAKVNHFITSFHLTHKARLLQNLERQRKRLAGAPGAPAFEWMPRAWLLPLSPDRLAVLLPGADGADALPPPPTPTTPRAGGEPAGPPLAMVLKPTAASRGDGFHLATTWEEALPFNRAGYMLQRYVHPPDLIERRKYHVRLYLLLTALDPPRAYVHREGYIKLAMQPYVPAFTADGPVSDATAYGVHVTNHRQGNVYEADPYHPLDRLWAHFAERGADVTAIQRSLHRALAQLVAVAVDSMREDSPPTFTEDHSFELFGVDVLFDEALRPSILEANLSPSMDTSASALLAPMKERVLRDTLRLAVTRPNVPAALPELPPGGEACTFEQARWFWIESEARRELANLGGYLPLMPSAEFWPHVQPLLADPSGYAARLHALLFT